MSTADAALIGDGKTAAGELSRGNFSSRAFFASSSSYRDSTTRFFFIHVTDDGTIKTRFVSTAMRCDNIPCKRFPRGFVEAGIEDGVFFQVATIAFQDKRGDCETGALFFISRNIFFAQVSTR